MTSPTEGPPLQPFAEPLPPYSLDELRGDLHHLIQPLIGNLRLDNRAAPDREREHTIDRLYLALALVDVAAGETTIQDYDVRMGRTRHGTGFFRNESGEVRAQIQALYMAAKQTDDPAQAVVNGALARAEALAAGHPDWMNVTQWPLDAPQPADNAQVVEQ